MTGKRRAKQADGLAKANAANSAENLPANSAEEGRSFHSRLTEGEHDDTDQLPRIPRKAGRPSRPLDATLGPEDHKGWEIMDGLLRLQCNINEVAAFFGRSDQWVRDRVHDVHQMTFMQYADQIRPLGLIGLRRKQLQIAMAGDRQMLIFLGQNYLGQSSKARTEVTGKDGAPIQTEDVTDPARIVLEGLATIAHRQQIAQQARAELAAGNRVESPEEITTPDARAQRLALPPAETNDG